MRHQSPILAHLLSLGAPAAEFPTSKVEPAAAAPGEAAPEPDVGEVLRRMDAGRTLSAQELEQHIADCALLMERAHARFLAHDNPADREEALLWMSRQFEAIRSRSPEVKAAMEAAALRRVEESVGYFLDQADKDRAALAGRAAG